MKYGCGWQLLRICTPIMIIMGSLLYASEAKKPFTTRPQQSSKPQTDAKKPSEKKEQKKEPPKPFSNFNDFAQKIYKSDKTEESAQQLEREFKQQEQIFARQKRCNQEIKLNLEDFNAQVEADKIAKGAKAPLTKALATLLIGQKKNIPHKSMDPELLQRVQESIAQTKEAEEGEKVERPEEVERPAVTLPAPTPQPSPLREEQPMPPVPSPIIEVPKPQKITVESLFPEEEEIELPEEPTPAPVEKPTGTPAQLLTPLIEKPASATIQVSQQQDLPIEIYLPLDKLTDSIKEHAKTPEQVKVAEEVSATMDLIFTDLSPSERPQVLAATETIVNAVAEQGTSAMISQVLPLVQTTTNYVVKIPSFSKIMKDNGVTTTHKGIDLSTLRFFIYELASQARSDVKNIKIAAKTVTIAINTIAKNIALMAPAVTGALAIEQEKNTQDALLEQFSYLLTAFDALIYGQAVNAYGDPIYNGKDPNALTIQLKNYQESTIRRFTGISFGTSPERITQQLLSLYVFVNATGLILIYAIEDFVKLNGPVMDATFMKNWQKGTLEITQYQNEETKVKHKRDYRTELALVLEKLKQAIENGINAITDDAQKESLTAQLNNLDKERTKFETTQNKAHATRFTKKKAAPLQKTKIRRGALNVPIIVAPRKEKEKPIVTPTPTIKETPPVPKPAVTPTPAPIKEPKKRLALPAPTAHPVTSDAELKELVRQIDALDANTTPFEVLSDFGSQLFAIKDSISNQENNLIYQHGMKIIEEKSEKIKQRIRQLETEEELQITINDIQKYIQEEKIVEPNQAIQWNSALLRFQRNNKENTKLPQEFKNTIKKYKNMIMNQLSLTTTLHRDYSAEIDAKKNFETILRAITNALSTFYSIAALLNNLASNTEFSTGDTQKITIAAASICALYDLLVFTLYTPDRFKLVLEQEKVAQNKKPLEAYQAFLQGVMELSRYIPDTLDEFKKLLLPEDQTALTNKSFDITTINSELLQDGKYIYEVPKGTPVAIDTLSEPPLTIPTLQELNAKHIKDYTGLLEEWNARIAENGAIEAIRALLGPGKPPLTPEQIDIIQPQLAKLKELMPTLFETDDVLKQLEEKATVISENKALLLLIKALKDEISRAQEQFMRANSIKLIEFEQRYGEIKKAIESLTDKTQFETQATEIVSAFSTYLETVATAYVSPLKTFPEDGYRADPDLQKKINIIINKIPKEFTNMMTQLQNLGFLETIGTEDKNPFNKLWTTLLTGYGYILVTFDALTAKLHDGAQNKRQWVEFLGLQERPTQFQSAQAIINNLLKPIATARSMYYQLLVEPYFAKTPQIILYLSGALNVLDLNLVDIRNDNGSYRYARNNNIKGVYSSQEALIFLMPTGLHMRNTAVTAPVVHGGDAQYQKSIDEWEQQIKNILPGEYTKDANSTLKEKLTFILDTPFGMPKKEYVMGLDPHERPRYPTTFATMYYPREENKPDIYEYLRLARTTNETTIRDMAIAHIDMFFITLHQRFADPLIITTLKELYKEKKLGDEIRNQIVQLCGNGFALLDSLIKWAYITVDEAEKNEQVNEAYKTKVKKFVGDHLKRYQQSMEGIVTQLMQLVPYLPDTERAAYEGQDGGFNLQPFAPITIEKGAPTGKSRFVVPSMITLMESPETFTRYLFAIGTLQATGLLRELEPITFEGIKLIQTGKHTEQTLKQSLKKLSTIVKKLGGSISASFIFDTLLELAPLQVAFEQPIFPSANELITLTKQMEPIFKTINKRTKSISAEALLESIKKQGAVTMTTLLNETAILLIRPYVTLFNTIEITKEQKNAYKDLVRLFRNSFTLAIASELLEYLTLILEDKPILMPTLKPAAAPPAKAEKTTGKKTVKKKASPQTTSKTPSKDE